MASRTTINETFEKGKGVFRFVPNFVPRRFGQAGGRLRLHPDDLYALGTSRGSILERWFASVVPAMNGPLAPPDEGLSYIASDENIDNKILFKDAVEELGADLIGTELQKAYGTWPMYAKFFDYDTPLFFHLHLDDTAAKRVGRLGKPESYYFPVQLNNHMGRFPVTYFGCDPDITQAQLRERLMRFELTDTRITELSRAYRIELGTGWYTPPGVLHAPGSVLTYEPQWNSDVGAVYENIAAGEIYPYDLVFEHCPKDKQRNIDNLLSLMDWEKNVDPHYKSKYFRPPIPCPPYDEGYTEKWIAYANPYIGAKELTILPGRTVTVKDAVAYGCIVIQGHGQFGVYDAEAAGILRFGQLSGDEYFIGESVAREGIVIKNNSLWEPMVILKHFAATHPDMPQKVD